jgi:cyclophilin family peptidyl-prolyl cis-trans isomerase
VRSLRSATGISLHSAAVPRAEKRQRKKENVARAREARAAAERRARLRRNTVRGVVVAVVAVGIFLLISLTRGGDGDDTTVTDTTAPGATATTAPAGTTAPSATTAPTETTVDADQRAAALEAAGCDPTVPDAPELRTYDQPEVVIDQSRSYTATIETSCGTIVAELDAEAAPEGVNNFVFLAREGFYDGLTWHRVVDGFVIQGGDPEGTGSGGPGYSVGTETPTSDFERGDLAYAKAGPEPPGTAGSQFFVVTGDPAALNQQVDGQYQYGRFGRVTEGLDVAQTIEDFAPPAAPPNGGPPEYPLYIFSIEITES